jgi:hypothetical protein
MTEPIATYATQAGHWYDSDGTPRYSIIGKNGKERDTTFRDAREHNLFPSVTAILKVLAAPGLEQWKQRQLLEAALTLPMREGESLDDYACRVVKDSQEHARAARDKGTAIHGALESWFRGEVVDHQYEPYVSATVEAIIDRFGLQSWQAERSFSCPEGYGGKVDLHSDSVVIDFKTKEFCQGDKLKCFDEHHMQLAAYRFGLGVPTARCANVFVSTSEPGTVCIVEHTEQELVRGFVMFGWALKLWQAQKNYYPCEVAE